MPRDTYDPHDERGAPSRRASIPAASPAFTEGNSSDPGITLLGLFAYLLTLLGFGLAAWSWFRATRSDAVPVVAGYGSRFPVGLTVAAVGLLCGGADLLKRILTNVSTRRATRTYPREEGS